MDTAPFRTSPHPPSARQAARRSEAAALTMGRVEGGMARGALWKGARPPARAAYGARPPAPGARAWSGFERRARQNDGGKNAGALRPAPRIPIRAPAVAATDNGGGRPERAAGA